MPAIANILYNCRQIRTRFPQFLQLSLSSSTKSISVSFSFHTHRYLSSLPSFSNKDTTHGISTSAYFPKKSFATFTFKGVTYQVPDPDIADLQTDYSPRYYYNMSSKHLATGSTCPPLQDGKLRIFSMRFCPYAQRAVLVALAKGIPHDVVNVNLKNKPEFLLEKNPLGKVPTIERADGGILYESLIVADYLDESYPNRPLNSSDPFQKALDRVWIELFGSVTTQFYKILFSGADPTAQENHMKEFVSGVARFDKELTRRGTKFFGGDANPGMLDYMIWPWFERAPVIKVMFPNLYDYENAKQEHPRLESWRQAMKEDSAVKEFYLNVEVHLKFMQGHMEGSPNYELLEEGAKL